MPLHLGAKVLPSHLGYVEPDTNGGQSSDRWKGSREVPRGMAWLKKASWRKEVGFEGYVGVCLEAKEEHSRLRKL